MMIQCPGSSAMPLWTRSGRSGRVQAGRGGLVGCAPVAARRPESFEENMTLLIFPAGVILSGMLCSLGTSLSRLLLLCSLAVRGDKHGNSLFMIQLRRGEVL